MVVLSLLFAQWALASYVCPGFSAAERMSERMAAGFPCEGEDAELPVLCHQVANEAAQSVEMAKVATPSLPAVVHMLLLPSRPMSAHGAVLAFSDPPEARPPPDPIFLETLRLRV